MPIGLFNVHKAVSSASARVIRYVRQNPAPSRKGQNKVNHLETDFFSTLADELFVDKFLKETLSLLVPTYCGVLRLTCRKWRDLTTELLIKNRLGPPLALRLKGQGEWGDLLKELALPLTIKPLQSSISPQVRNRRNPPEFIRRICTYIENSNEELFDKELRQITPEEASQLGKQDNGAVPLLLAARMGNLRAVQSLVEKGAVDRVKIQRFDSRLESESALFIAALRGSPAIVHYLLEHGDRPYLELWEGHSILFSRLIELVQLSSDDKVDQFLKCLLLILKVRGFQNLRLSSDATNGLNLAMSLHYHQVCDLMIGMGVCVEVNAKRIRKVAKAAVERSAIGMIEFLHRRKLFDFAEARLQDGSTFLALTNDPKVQELLNHFQK